jgi:hypothetical protein
MIRPTTVIDADGQICEPKIVWTEYTQSDFRDRVLQVRTNNGVSNLYLEGQERRGRRGAGPAEACIPGSMAPDRHLTWADILPGGFDPAGPNIAEQIVLTNPQRFKALPSLP